MEYVRFVTRDGTLFTTKLHFEIADSEYRVDKALVSLMIIDGTNVSSEYVATPLWKYFIAYSIVLCGTIQCNVGDTTL